MELTVNYVAVLAAAVSSMVVGAVWYAPQVFGARWQKLVKLSDKDMKRDAVSAMISAFLLSILTAYILYHMTVLSEAYFDTTRFQAALSTAFWLWLGISFTRTLTHDLFEQRPKELTMLNIGNQFMTIMVMGLVIGYIG